MRSAVLSVGLVLMAAVVPANAALRAQLVHQGFSGVVSVVSDPALPDTIYLVQLDGLVITVRNGQVLATPFLDLRSVVTASDERGLLGMAFPPDALTSGRVFVNFTNRSGFGDTVIARFVRSAADPRVVDPASRKDLSWPAAGGGRQPFITQTGTNHKGGHLAFGPDSYLYIGLGDGGGDNDPSGNAQNPQRLLGKMLRVNVSVPDADPLGYSIPPGNPTFPVAGALPEIWAFGYRNPWRYSFDDYGNGATNALIVGDVGQRDREEIDYEPAGARGRNYGWRAFEGLIRNPNIPAEPTAYTPVTPPIYDYPRAQGRSVIGGYVYRGTALAPEARGRYFFGDCVAGTVRSMGLVVNPATREATVAEVFDHTGEMGGPFGCITTFSRDVNGELYFVDADLTTGGGRLWKIVTDTGLAPATPTGFAYSVRANTVSFSWQPSQAAGIVSGFVVEAGSQPALADLGAVATTTPSLVVPGVGNGRYYARVRAVGPAGTSAPSADLVVTVGCTAPPAAPDPFTVAVAGGQVALGWTLPPDAIRSVLEVGYAPGATALTVPFEAPTHAQSVAAPPGTYFVRVRVLNECGQSSPSVERTVVVP